MVLIDRLRQPNNAADHCTEPQEHRCRQMRRARTRKATEHWPMPDSGGSWWRAAKARLGGLGKAQAAGGLGCCAGCGTNQAFLRKTVRPSRAASPDARWPRLRSLRWGGGQVGRWGFEVDSENARRAAAWRGGGVERTAPRSCARGSFHCFCMNAKRLRCVTLTPCQRTEARAYVRLFQTLPQPDSLSPFSSSSPPPSSPFPRQDQRWKLSSCREPQFLQGSSVLAGKLSSCRPSADFLDTLFLPPPTSETAPAWAARHPGYRSTASAAAHIPPGRRSGCPAC
eukprot:scaffold48_cov311-Pinguiococcus_pyrenoidosus.AAC.117